MVAWHISTATGGWGHHSQSLARDLTQFGDANLLQVLPGDISDEVDVLVAVLHQYLVVLGQADHGEPQRQVGLGREHRAQLSASWQHRLALAPQHLCHAGMPSCWGQSQRTPLVPMLFQCSTSTWGHAQPHSHGKPVDGAGGMPCRIHVVTICTSLMVSKPSGGDMCMWASSGGRVPAPTPAPLCGLVATPDVALLSPAPRSSYRLVFGQPLRDVEVVDLRGNLLPVPWLGDTDGRQVLGAEKGVSATLRQLCLPYRGTSQPQCPCGKLSSCGGVVSSGRVVGLEELQGLFHPEQLCGPVASPQVSSG